MPRKPYAAQDARQRAADRRLAIVIAINRELQNRNEHLTADCKRSTPQLESFLGALRADRYALENATRASTGRALPLDFLLPENSGGHTVPE